MVLGMVERREGRPGKVVAKATDPAAEGQPIARQVANRVSTEYLQAYIDEFVWRYNPPRR